MATIGHDTATWKGKGAVISKTWYCNTGGCAHITDLESMEESDSNSGG